MIISNELKLQLNKKFVNLLLKEDNQKINYDKNSIKNMSITELWACYLCMIASTNMVLATYNTINKFLSLNEEIILHIITCVLITIFFYKFAKKNQVKKYKKIIEGVEKNKNEAFINKVLYEIISENINKNVNQEEYLLLLKNFNENNEKLVQSLIKENNVFNKNELYILYRNELENQHMINSKKTISNEDKEKILIMKKIAKDFNLENEIAIMNKKILDK